MHSQAMEERRMHQVKIVEALEAEKNKISNELKEMQRRRAMRENQPSQNGQVFICHCIVYIQSNVIFFVRRPSEYVPFWLMSSAKS